jgi:glutathione transport system permease protein
MLGYLLRRVGGIIPVMLAVALFAFGFVHALPGDPARLIAGPEATLQDVNSVRERLGLDRPIAVQFARFLGDMVTGRLGNSIKTGQPVTTEIGERFMPTLWLSIFAMIWATIVGVAIGVLSGVERGRWVDQATMALAVSGISFPGFWLGLLLIDLFSVRLGWLPTGGYGGWRNFVMPSFTLGIGVAAVMARFTRSAFVEVATEDYVRTARAKGVPERRVIWGHALRNALIPVITLTGLEFGSLLGGAIVIETVFSWPGLGRLLVDSVSYRDYPVIQAEILLFSLEFVVINLAVDLLYAVVNPEIRLR